MSKWVNRDVRGSEGTPRGSRRVRGAVKVSQGMKNGVGGVPGVKGSLRDPRVLRGTLGVY